MRGRSKLDVGDKVRLLTVCDAENGVVLFERVWAWSGDSRGLGNLVRSFFQIAKQLDHGMVTRVVFETDDEETQMQMLCTKNQEIVVALFYEEGVLSDDEADAVNAAMRQFIEQSRELWRKHRVWPECKGVEDEQRRPLFDATIDGLLERIVEGL